MTGFINLSIVNRHLTFLSASSRSSDPSESTVKTDGNRLPFDNHRNLARTIGVFQHGVKMFGFFDHVIIIYLAAFFGKSFTSCPGVRSGIFSEKQNLVGHFFLLLWPIVVVRKTFRYSNVFLQPLIPQFHILENIYGKRYKWRWLH